MRWADVVIAVATMPERRVMVGELKNQLGPVMNAGAKVVTREHIPGDPPRVDFPAVLNQAFMGSSANWIMCMDDDIWLCPNFAARCLDALTYVEGAAANAVTFFTRSKRDLEMMAEGTQWRWQPGSAFSMTQCVAVRRSLLEGFPAWAPSWYAAHPQHIHATDLILGSWLKAHGQRMLVHVPSLVQHRWTRSTLPSRASARQSESYRAAFGEVPGEVRRSNG